MSNLHSLDRSKSPVTAVILAAGEGRRMRPITELIPKPLIPIDGRPFIEYLVQNLETSGLTPESIIVVVGYLHEKMSSYLRKLNPAIRTVLQPSLDGTAGALFCAMPLIPESNKVLMMMGDNYFSVRDLTALLTSATHALGVIQSKTPEKYGVIEIDASTEQKRITRILEKPLNYQFQDHVLVSAGLHYFYPEVRQVLTQTVARYRAAGQSGEIPLTDVISELSQKTSVTALELQDWQDMGTPADLSVMKKWILRQKKGLDGV